MTLWYLLLLPWLLAGLCLYPGERQASPTLTIAFVGDVMLGRRVAQYVEGDWTAAFAAVQSHLSKADLAIANLESPLTNAPPVSDGYDLRAPPEALVALQAAGFDAVSLANNHALDAGERGLQEMIDTLTSANIVPLLASKRLAIDPNRAAFATHTPITILAFDDSVNPLDVEAAAEIVAEAVDRAANAPVIVSIHWGGEYQAAPGPRQRAIAARFAQAGAAIIVGHGPHVLQRVEWIDNSLVAYSLGNFLFDQPYPLDCRWGVILHVTMRDERVVAVTATPTVAERGRVRLARPEEAQAILERLKLEA
ncbi:MAG TPA: CapA family protein [Chloroflexi bacterium]|nr:CapA family protein [Chloroflexota bacterium]